MSHLLPLAALLCAAANEPAPAELPGVPASPGLAEEPLVAPAAPTVPTTALARAEARLTRATRLHGALGKALDEPDESDGCGPGGSLVAGTLLGAGTVWTARESDPRGTWTVVLGTLATGALSDGVLGFAFSPDEACRARFRAAPSGTTEQRERAIEQGRACLRAEADGERTKAWLRLGFGLAAAGGAFALWGTEPPAQRDPALLAIGGIGAVLSFGALAEGDDEKRWQRWLGEELAADEALRD